MEPNVQKILQKFSTQKVELSSFLELKEKAAKLGKSADKLNTSWRDLSDYFTRAEKPYRKMMDAYDEAFGFLHNAELVYKNFTKGAEELGVDPRSIKEYKELNFLIEEVKKMEPIVDDLNKNFQNIQP